MNVLVWRMMLRPFAMDVAAKCPASMLGASVAQPLQLNAQAAAIASALCAWPNATDAEVGAAWDLVVGYLAPDTSRTAYIQFAHGLQSRAPDDALPDLWLGALLHPAFLLEQ